MRVGRLEASAFNIEAIVDEGHVRLHGGGAMSAFFNARGAPPPLALARRLRASLGPQALYSRQTPGCLTGLWIEPPRRL